MSRAASGAAVSGSGRGARVFDAAAQRTERGLRILGDPRLAVGLLVLAALVNVIAAADVRLRGLLDAPAYLALIAAILLTGIAGVAVRVPLVWREWRHPEAIPQRSDVLATDLELAAPLSEELKHAIASDLRRYGYRLIEYGSGGRWLIAGTKRGWSRFAALISHLALILMVVGGALGTAFATESRIGLFPGDQSLLAAPRPGLTSAMRFDGLDAAFDAAGNPVRFDTYVTFVRDGQAVRHQVLQVNDPGSFDGYLVHAWTYGPAVQIRVKDLTGRPLFDGTVALGGPATGSRAPFVQLPALGTTLGVALADAAANTLRITAAGDAGIIDATMLRPGEERRLGDAVVRLIGFTSYVTFLSRSDPGMPVLFAGAGLLTASFVGAFYFPRRRVNVLVGEGRLRIRVRGERFDEPRHELDRISRRLRALLAQPASSDGSSAA